MVSIIETLISTIQGQGEAVDVPEETIAAIVKLLIEIRAMPPVTKPWPAETWRKQTAMVVTPDIPRDILFPTWKGRGEWNAKTNGPVQGYAGLIKEMACATEDSLSSVTVKDANSSFLIFVTPSYERLIGVLYYPMQECLEYAERRKRLSNGRNLEAN